MAIYLLRQESWTVQKTHSSIDFHLDISKPNHTIAVLILDQRRRVTVRQIEKFVAFLEGFSGSIFTSGLLISTNGFSPSAYSFLREEEISRVDLALLHNGKIVRNPENQDSEREISDPIYIGVFTCKGGVGKTTISAHLAGAFATNGYNAALVDLDKQENLRKLLGDGVHVPKKGEPMGSVISVFNSNEWDEKYHKDIKIVVCDCNPEFDKNPAEFIRRFDYCIVPTTLNPLGINKNGDVIDRTLRLVRSMNKDTRMFVLINNLHGDEVKRNLILNQMLKRHFRNLTATDDLFHYIDPSDVAIRFSKQLLYWGFHLFEDGKPELAFRKIGRYSHPRIDFLKLVDFLEENTSISNAKPGTLKKSTASSYR